MNARRIARRLLLTPLVTTGLCYVRFGAVVSHKSEVELTPNLVLGRGVRISSFVRIKSWPGPLHIGAHSAIATGCFITSGEAGLEIGEHALIGPNCTIITTSYNYTQLDVPFEQQGESSKGVRIGRNVWLGAGVVVVDGSTIGDNVIVAPNSVVSGNIARNTVAQGNPASVVFTRR